MRKEEIDSERNGIQFKTIIWSDDKGVCKVKEHPKIIDQINNISGCHMFRDFPEQNHYDNFKDGNKWKDYNKNNSFPFMIQETISGAILLI